MNKFQIGLEVTKSTMIFAWKSYVITSFFKTYKLYGYYHPLIENDASSFPNLPIKDEN